MEDNLGISEHVWHGSALLWHESMGASVVNIKNVHERFTGIKIRVDGHSLLAISAYLPTSGKDDEYLDCLCQLSNFITDNTSVHDTVLIGTDANCSDKSTSRRLNSLEKFCMDHSLLKMKMSEPTFHHSNGVSSSNIDFFLISDNISTRLSNGSPSVTCCTHRTFPAMTHSLLHYLYSHLK